MKLKNTYLLVNSILVILFLSGLLYLLFGNKTIPCYYKTTYGVECKTCGFTRDFKTILNFKSDNLINSISKDYFIVFTSFFVLRLVVIGLLFKGVPPKKTMIFDVIVVALMFIYLLLKLF